MAKITVEVFKTEMYSYPWSNSSIHPDLLFKKGIDPREPWMWYRNDHLDSYTIVGKKYVPPFSFFMKYITTA